MLELYVKEDYDVDVEICEISKTLKLAGLDQYGNNYIIVYTFTRNEYRDWCESQNCEWATGFDYSSLIADWNKPQAIYFLSDNTEEAVVEEALYNTFGSYCGLLTKNLLSFFYWEYTNKEFKIEVTGV